MEINGGFQYIAPGRHSKRLYSAWLGRTLQVINTHRNQVQFISVLEEAGGLDVITQIPRNAQAAGEVVPAADGRWIALLPFSQVCSGGIKDQRVVEGKFGHSLVRPSLYQHHTNNAHWLCVFTCVLQYKYMYVSIRRICLPRQFLWHINLQVQ
jgi:hypothetical protein